MYHSFTVSVVFPAYNEAPYIRRAVEDFLDSGVVDEIVVVDNNSQDATAQEASRAGLALFALTLGLFLATHWAQLRADYSTRYRYTYLYADRQRAIEYVNQNVPDDGFLLADKDILWYATRPGEPIYPYLQPTTFVARLQAEHVDALVWTEKEWLKSGIKHDPQSLRLLEACFEIEQFGIFFVAMRTDRCSVLP